jgi:hypothetical protein
MGNNYTDTIVGDHVLIAHYVKYDRLTELINTEFYNSGYNEINLLIDAYSMIKSIYGLKPNQFIDKFSIASCIINACAHYRNFFWTRYRVTCKIWVVFSRMDVSIIEANSFYPTYANIFTTDCNPDIDSMIKQNMEILNTICPYIPDVSFIQSGYEPGLVFGKIAMNYPDIPNIIVSKDPWNLQVVGNMSNVYMLRPLKRNSEDLSILISNKNVLQYYAALRKVDCDMSKLHSSFISFIIAATRFPERRMKALHNMKTIVKYLNDAIDKQYIRNDSISDIKGLCTDLSAINKINLKSFEIESRMNAIGFNSCFYRYLTLPLTDNINIINLHDPDSIKQINEKYFSKVPLDLMSL